LSGPEATEGKKRKKNVAELVGTCQLFFFFSVTAGHHIFRFARRGSLQLYILLH